MIFFDKVGSMRFSYLLIFLSLFLMAASWQDRLTEIDQQIQILTEARNKAQATAEREANNAMRWQFQKENYLDARRAWDNAAKNKRMVGEFQGQIDQLNFEREQILKEHGQPLPS